MREMAKRKIEQNKLINRKHKKYYSDFDFNNFVDSLETQSFTDFNTLYVV